MNNHCKNLRNKADFPVLRYLLVRSLLFFLFVLYCLLGFQVVAQQSEVERALSTGNNSEIETSIAALFDSLSVLFDVDFAYDADLVIGEEVVKVVLPEELTEEWLFRFFDNEKVEVSIIDKQVIIGRQRGMIDAPLVIRIKGRVEELGTGVPLPMVNIGVLGKPVGTITNNSGFFEFLLPMAFAGEELFFSYLGYLTKTITIPSVDSVLAVSLLETSVRLPEVQVRVVNPNEIISKTREAVERNYPSDPYFLTAFFRETIQQNDRFVDVSEAVIEILKPSYRNQFDVERVRFIRGRKGRETSEMDLINFKLEGGPYHFSRLDVVRYRDFLPDVFGNSQYSYSYEGVDVEYGRMVYKIGFKPLIDVGELFYTGELRIDSESYAVVSAVFEMTSSSIRRSRNYLIRRDARRFRTRPFYARYKVDYRPWNDLWVLARVRGEVSLRIVDRSSRERTVFHTVSEMLVSDFALARSRRAIRWAETFRPDYILSDKIGDFDSDFWQEYNIIQPDEALEKVFGKE